jgi:hypothetical protein
MLVVGLAGGLRAAQPTTRPTGRGAATGSAPASKAGTQTAKEGQKYTKATPADLVEVGKWAAAIHEKVQKALKPKLSSFETTHFTIYTDWDPRE